MPLAEASKAPNVGSRFGVAAGANLHSQVFADRAPSSSFVADFALQA